MMIDGASLEELHADDDMVRMSVQPGDVARVDSLARRLRSAVRDPAAFALALEELKSDREFTAREVAMVAQVFIGGPLPKTRKAALTAIGQERLRLSHAAAKGASAARARAW
jgi:hypothetical protein